MHAPARAEDLLPRPPTNNLLTSNPSSFRLHQTTTRQSPEYRNRKPSIGIHVPPPSNLHGSFSSTASTAVGSPIRRKPVPQTGPSQLAKSRTNSQSKVLSPSGSPSVRFPPRKSSLASPISPRGRSYTLSNPNQPLDVEFVVRDLDSNPHGNTPRASIIPPPRDPSQTNLGSLTSPELKGLQAKRNTPSGLRYESRDLDSGNRTLKLPTEAVYPLAPKSPRMSDPTHQGRKVPLHIDITRSEGEHGSQLQKSAPRSPGVVLQSFFGWKSKEEGDASALSSPAVSPHSPHDHYLRHAKTMPSTLDIPRANGLGAMPTPPASTSTSIQHELEEELKEITTELASSIRREMELEDEVERLRALLPDGSEADPRQSETRRTSDYYSDSGASSSRYGDSDAKAEELERLKRKAEQERAQLRLEMSEKVAEVLHQKKQAEDRVQVLEDHVHHSYSRTLSPVGDMDRVRYLEQLLDDEKRKLAAEKHARDNMEELVSGMRHEIAQYRHERDNLKDEIVPQLESKLSSLETFVSEGQLYSPLERGQSSTNEDGDVISPLPLSSQRGLARSRSVATRNLGAGKLSRSNSTNSQAGRTRSRGNSMNQAQLESRDQLVERVRDMENQREALHKALKNLLQRHYWQEKNYGKQIRQLEQSRDKYMLLTPRRSAFNREVKNLREEIIILRKRADDALDQKWHCEKGLGGLKMDLDRAQQETSSLRSLLQEHDIELPAATGQSSGELGLSKAYHELRTTHALSMVHLNDLDSPSRDNERVLSLLKQSISDAEAERDTAQQQAEKYRDQARQVQQSQMKHLTQQQDLSSELFASASRMDALAEQVAQQITANAELRTRLTEAVERGEREQSSSAVRIAELQGKLRGLEDQLIVAQQASEDVMQGHEEDLKLMGETQRTRLHRGRGASFLAPGSPVGGGGSTPSLASPRLLFAGARSPRLSQTSSGPGISMHVATGTQRLERRVAELEGALADAEREMKEVISRMNAAQMEVAELQSQRDDATMRSRRLQKEMAEEREKVRVLMG